MTKGMPARLCPYSTYDWACPKEYGSCQTCDMRIEALAIKPKDPMYYEPSYWHTRNMPGSKIKEE